MKTSTISNPYLPLDSNNVNVPHTSSTRHKVRYQLDGHNHGHGHGHSHRHGVNHPIHHHHHVNHHTSSSNINNNTNHPQLLQVSPSTVFNSLYQILSSLAIFFLIVLCAFGLVTTCFILYLTIRPFSVPTYRRLSCNIGASALLDAMALLLPNTRIYLTGDSDPLSPVGVSVLVCNHVMEGDWWAILMLARCVGLRGSVKPFLQSDCGFGSASSTGSSNGNGNYNPSQSQIILDTTDNMSASIGDIDGTNADVGVGATTTNTSITMSASAPLLNSAMHHQPPPQHHRVGFKRNLSHQGVAIVGVSINNVNTNTSTNSSTTNDNFNNDTDNSSPRMMNKEKNTSPINSKNPNKNNNINNTNINHNNTTSSNSNNKPATTTSLACRFLHNLLDFPMLSSEHTQNYITDRNQLFSLLRSFASNGSPAPIHLLLFPEGWPEGDDRKSMMTKSIEFAKREGRPQLQHLLLPRTTGFYASLDSLREAAPVVYDVTMAYRGYDGGERPFSCDVSLGTIMKLIRGEIPNEVHIRIKRYSMEEVLSDAQWLDKQWSEKDRLLGKFARCGNFANVDNRGFCRYRVLDSRSHCVESSITAILRLGLIPFAIPVILILFVPLLWGVMWVWIAHRSFLMFFPGGINELIGTAANMTDGYRYGRGVNMSKEEVSGNPDDVSNGGTDSAAGTPFFPATPFASPTHIASWRSVAPSSSSKDSD